LRIDAVEIDVRHHGRRWSVGRIEEGLNDIVYAGAEKILAISEIQLTANPIINLPRSQS